MRGKKVLLSVVGIAQDVGADEASDEMRLVTTGELSGKDDAWSLRYTETQPDTAETHKVTFTMQDGVVTMSREGDYRTSMIFSQGNRYESSYNTPYGALDMGIFPTQVKYSVDDARGEVLLKYQLDIQPIQGVHSAFLRLSFGKQYYQYLAHKTLKAYIFDQGLRFHN